MRESFAEQLSRVELMSSGDPTWDLSPNDCLALVAVLAEIKRLRDIAETWAEWANQPRLAAEAAGGDYV